MRNSYRLLSMHAILWVLVVVGHMPLHLRFIGVLPNLPLLYVIYITIRCSSMSFLISSLLAGGVNDLIAGNVMGVTSMEFAIVAVSMHYNARALANQSFKFIWLSVLGLIMVCTGTRVVINYLILSQWSLDYTVIIGCLVTACFYPTIQILLNPLWKGDDPSDA